MHFFTYWHECVGLNMFEKPTFCFSKKKVFLGYLSEFCAVPANQAHFEHIEMFHTSKVTQLIDA